MSYGLSDEHEMIRDAIARWAAQECPRDLAAQWASEDHIPPNKLDQLAELGFFGITIPEEHGGQGFSMTGACLVLEEIAALSPPLAASYASVAVYCGAILSSLGSPEQRARWLPGCVRGTDSMALAIGEPDNPGWPESDIPSYEITAEGLRLSGTGIRALVCERSNALLVAAKPASREEPSPSWAYCVVPLDSKIEVAGLEKLGYHGLHLAAVTLRDVIVSAGDVLGGPDALRSGPEQRQTLTGLISLSVAAQGVGIARGAFDYALAYARERIQFGEAIGRFPAVREKFTALLTGMEAARTLTHRAAWLADHGMPFAQEATMAHALATRIGQQAGLESVHILGGYGYALEYDAQRYLKDGLGLTALWGTPESLHARLGAFLGL